MIIRDVNPLGINQTGKRASTSRQVTIAQPRFQSAAGVAGFATRLFKTLPQPPNLRVGGMSVEDWTLRLMTWTLYLPQGAMAIWYRQNPFEVWGRNIAVWLGSFAVVLLGKNAFNQVFNPFIRPQEKLPPLKQKGLNKLAYFAQHPKTALNYLINPYRPKANYLEIFHQAGINLKTLGYKGELTKKAMREAVSQNIYWASLDTNEKRLLEILRKNTKNPEQAKSIGRVIKSILACKILAVGLSGLLLALFVGIFIQKAVFKYMSPLDQRFVPKTNFPLKGSSGDNPNGRFAGAVPPEMLLQLMQSRRVNG